MKLVVSDVGGLGLRIEGGHKLIQPPGGPRPCTGCFGCWVKTPGKCVIHDGYEGTGAALGQCTELILISRCCYGSVSPFVKMVQDRAISYIHPGFTVRGGQMHHKRRYKNVVALSAYLYGADITPGEMETARNLLQANAVNYDGKLKGVFFYRAPEEMEGLVL